MSIGKGYYGFMFSNAKDARRVRAEGTLNLNQGSLKLFAWTRDFNPSTN